MFAGDRAASGDAQFENTVGEGFGGFFLTGDAAVVENQRVEIAVAGVKHICDAHACLLAQPLYFAHHLRQRRSRDHPVLHNIIWRDPPHRRKRSLASFPNKCTFSLGLRQANFRRTIRTTNLVDVGHQGFDFRERTIEFDEQQATTARIVRVDRCFRGLDGQVVHHFDGGRKHAGGDDVAHRRARFVCGGKSGEQRPNALGPLHEAQNDFGGNAQSAFGTHENSGEVIAGSIECLSAEMDERAIGKDDFQAEDMRCGKAVLQAMCAA